VLLHQQKLPPKTTTTTIKKKKSPAPFRDDPARYARWSPGDEAALNSAVKICGTVVAAQVMMPGSPNEQCWNDGSLPPTRKGQDEQTGLFGRIGHLATTDLKEDALLSAVEEMRR
jgi:hypothetical protein